MSNTANIMSLGQLYGVRDTTKKANDENKVVNPTKITSGNVYIQATNVTSSKRVASKTIKTLKPASEWKFHQVYIAIFDSSNKILIGSSMNTTKLMEIIRDEYFSPSINEKLAQVFTEYCEVNSKEGKQVILA